MEETKQETEKPKEVLEEPKEVSVVNAHSEPNPDCSRDLIIIKDCVCLVDNAVKQYGAEQHDSSSIDLLVKLDSNYSYIKRAIDTRLNKAHEKVYAFYEPLGPHSDHVPLYDLVLRRVDDTSRSLVELKEDIESRNIILEPLKPFIPMKSENRFYEIDEVINYAFKN